MYTPGVVSAVLVTLPYSAYLFYKLMTWELVTIKQILFSIPVGLLIIPIVLIGHELGRRIVPHTEK
jgi:NhaP-type Na+/H+ or K+/H+ antiporter